MGWHWSSGSEALRVAELDRNAILAAFGGNHLSDFCLQNCRIDSDPRIHDQVSLFRSDVRGQRQFRSRVVADNIPHSECAGIVHADQLQVCDFAAQVSAHCRQFPEYCREDLIQVKWLWRGQSRGGVQPAQFGFAFGISIVIDIEDLSSKGTLLSKVVADTRSTGMPGNCAPTS
jgi:hypothetical protein